MASGWTNEQVITWLKSLNPVFDKYEEKFKAEGVDGDMLMDIKDEDLEKQLGIPIKLHRNKILKCVAELKAKPADGAAAAPAAAAPVLAPPPAAAKEAKAVGGKRAAAAPADDEPAEKKRKTTAGPKGKAKASSKKKQKEEEEDEEEEEEAEEKDEEDEAEEKGSSSSSSGGGPDGVYKLKAGGGEYHLISREGAEKETISECLERVGLPDIKGASYYMLGHKKESVSANKEIVVVPKSVIDAPKNGAEAVDGAEARKRIGLKGAGKINEDISGDYTVFVQSTSANRGLEPDAWLLSKVGGAATKGAAKGKAAKGKAPAKSKAKAKPKGKGKKKKDEEEDEEEEEEEDD